MAQETGDAIEALIQRCLQGDQAAWDQIVRQYWRKVFNVAYKFVGKHDEAEDLTQDIFLKIFRSLDTFDRRANFQTWLISISRNLCIDHYRSVRKERETIDRDVDANELAPLSHDAGPMAALEQQDRVALLKQAMAALPETLRTAVLMRDIQELSYQEIADRLRLPERHDAQTHGSLLMNVKTDSVGGIGIVRVGETRLMYPILSDFSSAVTGLVSAGKKDILIDMTPVTFVDSATIGCLMDLYRQVHNGGGHLKLSGVQKRVETMLTMTGAQNFIEIHADEPSAVKSFGA
jgi:RNA polymerase sigma factor (sigma-70 family)/anti-anti-sigma factor